MTLKDAVTAAQKVLKDEANELAMLMHDDLWKSIPHRARVAIQTEITRLRDVAERLNDEESEGN